MAEKNEKLSVKRQEAKGSSLAESTTDRKTYVPSVDISETESSLIITADMPGADESSVNITLENDLLAIEARIDEQDLAGVDDHSLTLAEYGVGDYYRAFTLNEAIDREKIRAKIKNGVLGITLPKAQSARTKSIPIQVG